MFLPKNVKNGFPAAEQEHLGANSTEVKCVIL